MATPCRAYGCPNIVKSRLQKGYCDDHADKRTNWQKSQAKKGNTTERGYGYKWQKLRERIIKRDCNLCQVCIAKGIYTEATDVDHIVNKANGGTDDEDNLQCICKVCHKAKTLEESKTGGGSQNIF